MKQSFLGFLKKVIFGSDEDKAEAQKETTAKLSDESLEEKPAPFMLLVREVELEKTIKKQPKEKPPEKVAVKTKTRPKAAVKKTTKIVLGEKVFKKKLLAKALVPKKSKARPGTKKKQAEKRKTKNVKPHIKPVWPKPKDSHIRHEKVKALEQKVSELAAEHNVPSEAVEQATQIDAHKALREQASLPRISETEEKVESAKKAGKGMEHHEILGLIGEIQKHRIITDFDRIYDEVTEKKRVSAAKLSHDLEIPKDRVEECAKILEEDKLVEVDYPPVGDEFLQLPRYSEDLKEEKEMQKKAKKMAVKKSNAQKGGLSG